MRQDNQMHVLRHDYVSPKIERAFGPGGVERFEEPYRSPPAPQERAALKTGKCQAVGIPGNVPSFAAFSMFLVRTDHAIRLQSDVLSGKVWFCTAANAAAVAPDSLMGKITFPQIHRPADTHSSKTLQQWLGSARRMDLGKK
jgi:hypothetical protein